jgi:uncharacterized membrane-anchored protein
MEGRKNQMATKQIKTNKWKNEYSKYEARQVSTKYKNVSIVTDSWVCPDGTGVWIATDLVIESNFNKEIRILHRIKVSPTGDILKEETYDTAV